MKYLVFNTENEAIAAEASIAKAMGLPKQAINALTGEPVEGVYTERWAMPMETTKGKWAIPSDTEDGVVLTALDFIKDGGEQ